MKVQAYQKYIRISPRKLKVMIDSVKDMSLVEMEDSLSFSTKKSAKVLLKVIKQAISNARQKEADMKKWQLDTIQALKGPVFKRWQAVSRGRGHSILKRTSHLRVVLLTKDKKPKTKNEKLKVKDDGPKAKANKAKTKDQNQKTKDKKVVKKIVKGVKKDS